MISLEPYDSIEQIQSNHVYNKKVIAKLRDLSTSYASCPDLWVALGDALQLSDDDYPIEEAVECYQTALRCDDSHFAAYEELGWVSEGVYEDLPKAEEYFRLAIQHGADETAMVGLARVLAQTGRESEALQVLRECEDQSMEEVAELRREIKSGVWRQ